ncbi:hypothetical protein Fmac_030980 [Flemingia macrophylla]|uniref:RNase H type-1 domain-containing protein n=1 Tax=Flemingia macrophylla TaxID=520843 RepID=A0ABD1L0R1_9FABA
MASKIKSIPRTIDCFVLDSVQAFENLLWGNLMLKTDEVYKNILDVIGAGMGNCKAHHESLIVWEAPPNDVLKINCDGVVNNVRLTSCGGVIRDAWGKFICTFVANLGRCSVLKDELWAMFHGLKLLSKKRIYGKVELESDSILVVRMLNEGYLQPHPCYGLINMILEQVDHYV